ncbi:MFS transporter [Microbaculum marinum]|uniref:MFS transporter n=1 Tax=Microbaculum marinum TaxID=1764581 RepID=A0AAW9REI6_9HYPH
MVVRARSEVFDGPYAWFRLAVSVLLATTGSVGMWAVVVVLPKVQAEFDVDRATASLPYTATMLGFALGNVLIGRYVDRLGIVLPVIGASVALSAGFVLAALSTGVWQFAVIQGVLIGIGTSATFGPLIADISHWFRARRGVAVAATASGNYLAGAIWPTALQGVLVSEGWRTTYIIIGIVCLAIMLPLSLLLRRRIPVEVNAGDALAGTVAASQQVRTIGLSPRALQILLVIAGLGCCVAMSMPQVHIVAYCADLGYGVARGAEMLSLMLVGGVASRLASGFLADRIGGVRTLLVGSVGQCLALVLYMPFDGLASLYVVSFIFGLSQGGIVPSYAIIVREYLPAREAGQRVGVVIMATVIGMALGGWLSGWIYDLTGSYRAAFLNGIAWNLLNIAIMLMILGKTRTMRTAAI